MSWTKRYVVIDPVANAIVLDNRAQERGHFASLAKILGLTPVMEALSHSKTKFGDKITVPRNLDRGGLISSMVPGGEYSRKETLARAGASSDVLGILALSHHLAKPDVFKWGGDTHAEKEQNTINYANRRLKEIGLTNTNLTHVDGRNSSKHYSTVFDIAIAMDYNNTNFPKSIRDALSAKVRGKHSSVMVRNGEAEWGKTGWLKAHGYSQAVYVERDGKPLILVMAGYDRGPKGARSSEIRKAALPLLDKAYDIINSPDYHPEKVYHDVKYDINAPLPTENTTGQPTSTPGPLPSINEEQEYEIPKTAEGYVDFSKNPPVKIPRPRIRPDRTIRFPLCDAPEYPISDHKFQNPPRPVLKFFFHEAGAPDPQTYEEMFEAIYTEEFYEKMLEEHRQAIEEGRQRIIEAQIKEESTYFIYFKI